MKLTDMKVDSAAIEAGRMVSDIDVLTGIDAFAGLSLQVRGIGNSRYLQRRDDLLRGLKISDRSDTETLRRIDGQVLAETVLMGWSGFTDSNGNEIPYSLDYATKLIQDPDFRLFRVAITAAAASIAKVGGSPEPS